MTIAKVSVTQTVGATVTRGQGIGMTGSVMTVSTWIDGEAINPFLCKNELAVINCSFVEKCFFRYYIVTIK